MSIFQRFRDTLQKTRQSLTEKVTAIFTGKPKVSEETLEELLEALIAADVGPATSERLIDDVRTAIKQGASSGDDVKAALEAAVVRLLAESAEPVLPLETETKPYCVLVVGVNGVGKTTTIAKLAKMYRQQGKSVLLVAGDTFRAAAIEQLETWAHRAGCDVIKHREGSDPAAVVFDAMTAARSRHVDVVIVDTAGRLHTKVNLMNELKKIRRVMEKEVTLAPHETLLVLDGNTGQNAIQQARIFKEATSVTGIVITKLDGTAKGGVVLSIVAELNIPVRFITTGETIDDIAEFSAEDFAMAMFK